MQNEADKIKYNINFKNLLSYQTDSNLENDYFSPELWRSFEAKIKFSEMKSDLWKQTYEKNLVFALGMLCLHYIMLEPNDDCYNYKSK